MIRFEMFFGVVDFAMTIYCLVEAITTPDGQIRNLPKFGWIMLILFFPVVGWVAWLAAGRPVADQPRAHEPPRPVYPEYDRPGRAAGPTPESDEEFLRKVRERAEEQRKAYEAEKKRKAQEEEG
jgi:hypothetical protein